MSGLPRTLEPNLLVGYDSSDDAAVYRLTDELALIQTVDFFPPVVDDPYDFGQIAAANALSDVYAMGGEPRLAMNLLAVPSCLPREAVGAILEGGAAKVAEAGAVTAGGHSIEDTEPKYGLCVSGLVHPGAVLTNRGAREGDLLVLTKPLGSGILTTAAKAELLSGAEYRAMTDLMAALNRDAARAAVPLRPSACTDVTGFGLIGHAREMAEGAGCTIELWPGRVPIVPQALELARELEGKSPIDFPRETAMGALALYISDPSVVNFQPMNVNFGLIPPLGYRVKGKRNKNAELSKRALEALGQLDLE